MKRRVLATTLRPRRSLLPALLLLVLALFGPGTAAVWPAMAHRAARALQEDCGTLPNVQRFTMSTPEHCAIPLTEAGRVEARGACNRWVGVPARESEGAS